MKNNRKDFSYLFKKDEEESVDNGISNWASKTVFILFALFLVLFAKYAPYGNPPTDNPSLLQNIFNLYFFISNQTFGIV
ncbi:MAG: hypothetical protein JXQ76_03505, partial [Campylobacterales bacterium]|nr:hypothetical protein [Campylobacterales bacterium]